MAVGLSFKRIRVASQRISLANLNEVEDGANEFQSRESWS